MARAVSLLAIRTEIVNQGGYKNSPVFTDTVLNLWINRAIAKVYDLVWQSGDDYYTSETTLLTVAGNDAIALPADFKKHLGLGRQDDNRFSPLVRMPIQDWAKWEGDTGKPHHYRIQRGQLRLAPKPDAIYTLRMLYLPVAPQLVVDGDTFDSIDYFDELVIAEVLLKCAGRDERQLNDIRITIDGLTKNIAKQAEALDAAEPIMMRIVDELEDDW